MASRAKKRLRTGLENTAKRISEDAALRDMIVDTPNVIFLRDFSSPSTQKHRQRTLREFLTLMRAILVAEGEVPYDIVDGDLQLHCLKSEKVVDYVIMYLHAVAESPDLNRGVISAKFKIGSLQRRTSDMWWWATWYLAENACDVYIDWQLRIDTTGKYLANKYDLGTISFEKFYFSTPELWLLWKAVKSTSHQASWVKQHFAAWALMLVTGARPGSLILPEDYSGTEMFFRWRDIRFLRLPDHSGIFLEITLRWLKGGRDLRKQNFPKGITFLIRPPTQCRNLIGDLTWIITSLAIERGLFGDPAKTHLDDLENSHLFELPQSQEVTDQPVFLAGHIGSTGLHVGIADSETKPLSYNALNVVFKAFARRAEITGRVSLYCWRREALTAFERSAGRDIAASLAAHKPDLAAILEEYYDYGVGDLDVTEVRFAEGKYASATERNRLRQLLSSPAVHNLTTKFDEAACRAYIKHELCNDESWVEFDEAKTAIINLFRDKFQCHSRWPAPLCTELRHKGDNLSTVTELIVPSHQEDAKAWIQAAEEVSDELLAVELLNKFMWTRRININWIRAQIKKEYISDWSNSAASPTVDEVNERINLADNPFASERVKWDGLTTVATALEQDEADYDEDYDKETPNNVLYNLKDGVKAEVSFPDEDEEVGSFAPLDLATSRKVLVQEWNDLTDIHWAPQNCPLCLAHPWNPTINPQPGGFKIDRHICAPTGEHVPSQGNGAPIGAYARWSKNEDGRWYCRLCEMNGEAHTYGEYKKLSQHLKKHHAAFVKSLAE